MRIHWDFHLRKSHDSNLPFYSNWSEVGVSRHIGTGGKSTLLFGPNGSGKSSLMGAVIWVFISEIFPNRQRAMGQTLGSSTHWIFAALLTTFFPTMVTVFAPGYVFLFFCFMMVLQLIWVRMMVIETKGLSLEQVQRRLGVGINTVAATG